MQDPLWTGGAWERSGPTPEVLLRPGRKKKKKRRDWLGNFFVVMVMCAAVLALAGALVYAGIMVARFSSGASQPSRAGAATTVERAPVGDGTRLELHPRGEQSLPWTEVYERTIPSIVYVRARQEKGASGGSGVIMSEDGYLLTNWHVVEGSSGVQVTLNDDTVLDALLVGWSKPYDLAVLKIDARGLTPAQFATSADVRVGDPVAAIGNPLGNRFRGSMTEGIISALDRTFVEDGIETSMLQTSAPLNPGNSGGALVNDRGQVIGITTSKMVSQRQTIEALGFAIPSRRIKGLTNQIIASGQAGDPMLGIKLTPVEGSGLEVFGVHRDSDAFTQGLRPGDVITHAGGVELTSINVLLGLKQEFGVGERMELTVERSGKVFTVSVMLMDDKDLP